MGRSRQEAGRWESVAWYASDFEAQIARSLLESQGIRAIVEYIAAASPPRPIAAAALPFPGAGFHVCVPPDRARFARTLIGAPFSSRPRAALRWLLVGLVLAPPLVIGLATALTHL